jgi:nucleotide-binding universal stress UspA family protein
VKFKEILVPVDGSVASNRGLEVALDLARPLQAHVTLLHVIDSAVMVAEVEVAAYAPAIIDQLRTAGEKIIERAKAIADEAGVPCDGRVVDAAGKAVSDMILDEARRTRSDLIAMGRHGRRGLARILMGSDAEAVVREATVPVLLVRADEKKKS